MQEIMCQAIFIYFFSLKSSHLPVRPLILDEEVFAQMCIVLNTRFNYAADGTHPEGKQTTVVSSHFCGMRNILWNILWNEDILWKFCGTVFRLGFFKCH